MVHIELLLHQEQEVYFFGGEEGSGLVDTDRICYYCINWYAQILVMHCKHYNQNGIHVLQ